MTSNVAGLRPHLTPTRDFHVVHGSALVLGRPLRHLKVVCLANIFLAQQDATREADVGFVTRTHAGVHILVHGRAVDHLVRGVRPRDTDEARAQC